MAKKGEIKDRTGEVNYNNFGSKMEIIAYREYKDIDVYFEEYNWTYYNAKFNHFINGCIQCPYEPRYFNKGYYGEYDFSNEDESLIKDAKNKWRNMLRRAYDISYKNKNYTYEYAEICEEWHNFSVFYQWYKENYYHIENQQMELDKDILIKNNKIYSPQTCIFVPHRINVLFCKHSRIRGDYPIGITYRKKNNVLEVRCGVTNKIGREERVFLGLFPLNQVEKAFMVYKKFKENYIKQVADEYKGLIPQELYEAMYRYEVEITD